MLACSWFTLVLLLVLVLAAWRGQHWKSRARAGREELAALREALHAMAYDSANAVTAIRAHLGNFRQVNPTPAMPEHLEQIAVAADRIARAVRIADDPVGWYRQRQASSQKPSSPGIAPSAPCVGDVSAS
ncbi:MAG: hypothetical protein ACP5U2_01705 [Bryobacteraceae bacterium]